MSGLNWFGRIEKPIDARRIGNVLGRDPNLVAPHAYASRLRHDKRFLTASVRNPNAFSSENEPVEIRVSFDQGVCDSPSHMIVRDDVGTNLPYQWAPTFHPVINSDISRWPDGSVRQGSLFVPAFFAGAQTRAFSVEITSGAQTPGVQNVIYGSETGTLNYLQTPLLRTRFSLDRAWIPKSFRDPSRALVEYSSTGNSLFARRTIGGVNKFSYNVADVIDVGFRRLGEQNHGYGVVFQDVESIFYWADDPTSYVRTRMRQFSNNILVFDQYFFQGATTASGNHGVSTYINIADSSNPAAVAVIEDACAHYSYADGRKLIAGFVTFQAESPAYQPTGENNLGTVFANEVRLGFGKDPQIIPAGAFFSTSGYIGAGFDSSGNEVLRRHTPCIARATDKSVAELKAAIKSNLLRLAAAWLPAEMADTTEYVFGGTNGLVRLAMAKAMGAEPPVAEALRLFEIWASKRGINPRSANSYHTQWNNLGWEFIGPGTGVLPVLRKEFLSLGDAENTALLDLYIHTIADFVVQAEVTSGGSGQMRLRGTGADNYNAEASAMSALCDSLAIVANSTRQATLDRIAARFITAYQIGTKTAYDFQAAGSVKKVIQFMRAAYHFYNLYAAIRAHRTYPCLPSQVDYRVFSLQYFAGAIADEYRWNKQHSRRGLPSNQSSAAYVIALGAGADVGDWQHAYDLIRHLADKLLTAAVSEKTIDGHLGTFDGTLSAAWGGSDAPAAAWHLLYELASD